MFAKMKIGTRLWLGLAVLLGFSVALTGIGIWQLERAADATRQMMREPLTKERLISDWSRNTFVAIARTSVVAKSGDNTVADYFAKDAKATTASTTELLKQIEPLIAAGAEKELFEKIVGIRKGYGNARDAVMKLKAEGKSEEATAKLEKEYLPASVHYQKGIADLLQMQRGTLDQLAARIDAAATASRNLMGVLAGLAVILGVLGAWALARSITRPMKRAVELANKVADGDLTATIEVTSRDETGEMLAALQRMNGSLRKIVSEVRTGTESISGASAEIASGNADLSRRTEQQAANLEETASSMEELTSTVKQNAVNARQANELAVSAQQVAAQGGAVVGEVVQTMSSINESSKKIADIIGVIDGIAFQTNILALNAAVEAARAGEQGRGFAVVASEVRTLAQRSASAAKEIKQLISESVSKVDDGTKLVDQAGRTMDEIVASVARVTDIIGGISAASDEQSAGIEQVNIAVTQMDQMTQQNAALVEEAAAAAESMQQQSQQLGQMMAVFKIAQPAARPTGAEGFVERRGPNRAKNVTRLPAKAKAKAEAEPKAAPAKKAEAKGAAEPAKTGTDGDWSEF